MVVYVYIFISTRKLKGKLCRKLWQIRKTFMQDIREEIDKRILDESRCTYRTSFHTILDEWLRNGHTIENRTLNLRLGYGQKLVQCYKPDENFVNTLKESSEAVNTLAVNETMLDD